MSAPALPPAAPDVAAPAPELPPEVVPNLDDLVTQDDTPVDSIFAEKQQRLLTHCLYASWAGPGRTFLALANVGYFHTYRQPALVPDVLLALDVGPAGDLHSKEGHSYFQWLMGKPPDVIVEIVSDKRGDEDGTKMRTYARQGVPFYVIFDPLDLLGKGPLRAFALQRTRYEPTDPGWLPEVGLGLRLWEGAFEGQSEVWLRWCGQDGQVIPTGAERAQAVEEKNERLRAQLRALGVEPEA